MNPEVSMTLDESVNEVLGFLTGMDLTYGSNYDRYRVVARMLNRALFDRITIDDEDDATRRPTEAIQTILATNPRPHNERTLPRDDAGQGSNVQLYVELRRIELLTSSLRTKRSTN